MVNKKEKSNKLGFILEQLPFAGNGARKLVGYFKHKQKIRKRIDTDVAFTREYSKVSIFYREHEVYLLRFRSPKDNYINDFVG